MQYLRTQDHTTTGQTNKVVVLNFDDFLLLNQPLVEI